MEGFPGGTNGEESACQFRKHETQFWSLGQEDPVEKGIWRATVDADMVLQRLRHD